MIIVQCGTMTSSQAVQYRPLTTWDPQRVHKYPRMDDKIDVKNKDLHEYYASIIDECTNIPDLNFFITGYLNVMGLQVDKEKVFDEARKELEAIEQEYGSIYSAWRINPDFSDKVMANLVALTRIRDGQNKNHKMALRLLFMRRGASQHSSFLKPVKKWGRRD